MATTKNTAFKVHVETISHSEMNNINIEDGALCRTEDGLYMGHSGSMVRLYPQSAQSLGLGWARIDDTIYTESNKLSLTDGVVVTLPNNAGNVVHSNGSTFYNATTQKFISDKENDVYMLTVVFKASTPNTQQTHLDLQMIGSGEISRINTVLQFYKGNYTTQNFHQVMQFYTDSDFVSNGSQLKINSHGNSAQVWDIIYFIQKTQSYA